MPPIQDEEEEEKENFIHSCTELLTKEYCSAAEPQCRERRRASGRLGLQASGRLGLQGDFMSMNKQTRFLETSFKLPSANNLSRQHLSPSSTLAVLVRFRQVDRLTGYSTFWYCGHFQHCVDEKWSVRQDGACVPVAREDVAAQIMQWSTSRAGSPGARRPGRASVLTGLLLLVLLLTLLPHQVSMVCVVFLVFISK